MKTLMIMRASTPPANAHLLENNHYQWPNTELTENTQST